MWLIENKKTVHEYYAKNDKILISQIFVQKKNLTGIDSANTVIKIFRNQKLKKNFHF